MEKEIKEINQKLNIILIMLLKENGLGKKEIAKVLGIGDKTIDKIVPYSKLRGEK